MPPARDLFVYGTLRDAELVLRLTGRRFATRPAVLEGYEKFDPRGGYPWIAPRPGAQVEGIVLCDVDDASLARLDAYEEEGRLYRREEVVVRHRDGSPRRCHTYVGRDVRGAA